MEGKLHFSACVKSSCNNECFGDTVYAISECTRVVPIFESDGTWTYSTRADNYSKEEENADRNDFDTVRC